MSEFNIFGASAPSGVTTVNGDTAAVNLALAWYVVDPGATGYRSVGARFWLASDSGSGTGSFSARLYEGTSFAASTLRATGTLSTATKGAWNEVRWSSPYTIAKGTYYWVSVYFPDGCYSSSAGGHFNVPFIQSPANTHLYASGKDDVVPGNMAASYGSAGTKSAPATSAAWYAVDVIVDDGASIDSGTGGNDILGMTDSATATRTGLASSANFSGLAVDPLGASTSTSASIDSSPTSAQACFVHSMNTSSFGSVITPVNGPSWVEDVPVTLGTSFWLSETTQVTGLRIMKHPSANGSINIRLYDDTEALLGTASATWTAGPGGWRDIMFTTPITCSPGREYVAAFYGPSGFIAFTPWVYNGQDHIVPPFTMKQLSGTGGGSRFAASGSGYPSQHTASSYYIDVLGQIPSSLPFESAGYMDQWVNYDTTEVFPIGVFYPDPEWLDDYTAMGINTGVGVPIDQAGYRDAILTSGMDVWATTNGADNARLVAGDPDLGTRVMGYFLCDEPDINPTYVGAQDARTKAADIRRVDSTRPLMVNFGIPIGFGTGFWYLQPGKDPNVAYTENWANVMDIIPSADVISIDWYNLNPLDTAGFYGVWTYANNTTRLQQFGKGQKAVWGYIETASGYPAYPTPDLVEQALWAHIIAGAKGIVLFDHRFANGAVTQDFAALLHDPPLKARLTTLCATVQNLAPIILADDADLVTAASSSNTTAGPYGGTYGVPIHMATRSVAGDNWVFAQSIRPGTTVGSFTAPSAAGKTITVYGESRTITANGSGVFIDTFASDYDVHIYNWS